MFHGEVDTTEKTSLDKRHENTLAKQGEPQGGQSVTGGFILLPQTEGFIPEQHREFSVLCLFLESGRSPWDHSGCSHPGLSIWL